MADKRINALANTASSTASDDFIAVDGTTNGTRKLNAFSPTFGGNVAVTGTLTSTGRLFASDNVQIAGSATWLNSGGGGTFNFVNGASTANTLRLGVGDANAVLVKSTGTEILATTASTTTSSGALVVGNGTSGGLGVGGSIYAGDNINSVNPQGQIQILGTGNTTGVKVINLLRSDGGDACSIGLTGSAYNGVFNAGGLGNSEGFLYNAAPFRVFIGTASTNRFDFTSSQFKINPTTASTSTSSGALVVSGGVGVAGAGNFGGAVGVGGATVASRLHVYESTSGTGDSNGITIEQASTADAALQFLLTGVQRWTVGIDNSDSDKFKIGTGTIGAADRLTLDTTGNATLAGSVQTSAPSGGTAAAWKLGTVATVSPTSPNRTIEVDIGGTIYYIAAKTTNN